MMARGEVALIVTGKAMEVGLPGEFMIMTVLLILVSSILTPILLKVLYGREKPSAGDGTAVEPVTETVAEEPAQEGANQ